MSLSKAESNFLAAAKEYSLAVKPIFRASDVEYYISKRIALGKFKNTYGWQFGWASNIATALVKKGFLSYEPSLLGTKRYSVLKG
jgi:hypothetical protein